MLVEIESDDAEGDRPPAIEIDLARIESSAIASPAPAVVQATPVQPAGSTNVTVHATPVSVTDTTNDAGVKYDSTARHDEEADAVHLRSNMEEAGW